MPIIAADGFERYFSEKLWEMIPAVYRHEDGLGEHPGTLRGIVEVLAGQAALLRRSHDRLWEDQFIELCNDWAVPYLADLVGTRLVSALNKRARRIDVAKTIYYRRRKGTPRILEELISDITGWDGKLVEQFQRLGRARHGLDPEPLPLAGRFSGTQPGGWADLRRPRASEVADGPFDEFFHTPDMRRHRGHDGRYGISKLAFHLYRLASYPVVDATPFPLGDGRFTFDPSGRDIPLFNRGRFTIDPAEQDRLRFDWEQWRSALEWELAAPMRCRLLGHAEFFLTEAIVQRLIAAPGLSPAAIDDLRTLRGVRFLSESRLRTALDSLASGVELLDPGVFIPLTRYALTSDCGKEALLPDTQAVLSGSPNPDTGSVSVTVGAPPAGIVTAEYITSANLSDWDAPPPDKTLAIDPERGRFLFAAAATPDEEEVAASYHYGFSGPVGAGTHDRSELRQSVPDQTRQDGGVLSAADLLNDGTTQIEDNHTYGPVSNKLSIRNLTLQAANGRRPYLRLESNWILDTGANADASLTLSGLWIGNPGNQPFEIILRGDYECVTIRHCTIDPGGGVNALGEDLLPVAIVVEGAVEKMVIDACITGPVATRAGGIIEELVICDSIIQSVDPAVDVLALDLGEVKMERVTLWGEAHIHRLYASETLATDHIEVTDTQFGCFRFGAAPAASRLPRPYESFLFTGPANHWFTSRRFGHPGYGQLSETAPAALRRGAETGSEMGAFSALNNPIKLDGLRAKVEEYMPFGLIPIFIHET